MTLKDFVENFNAESKMKITYKEEVLYEGEAGKLLYLLKANTKNGTGKNIDGVIQIEITPY